MLHRVRDQVTRTDLMGCLPSILHLLPHSPVRSRLNRGLQYPLIHAPEVLFHSCTQEDPLRHVYEGIIVLSRDITLGVELDAPALEDTVCVLRLVFILNSALRSMILTSRSARNKPPPPPMGLGLAFVMSHRWILQIFSPLIL